jgi:hypothetical protein
MALKLLLSESNRDNLIPLRHRESGNCCGGAAGRWDSGARDHQPG